MAYILRNILLLGLCMVAISSALYSKDLGVHGHLFPIIEPNLLQYIRDSLSQMTPEEVQSINQKIKNNYLKMIKEPNSVSSVTEAYEYKVYSYDPTVSVANDITDHNGNIIVSKGTSVNPLTLLPLSKELLFIDGTKESHIAWIKSQNKQAKWILVKGKPLDLEKEEEHSVYFDQFGYLVNKLGIQHVPARVSQEGLLLKVEEIPVGGNR